MIDKERLEEMSTAIEEKDAKIKFLNEKLEELTAALNLRNREYRKLRGKMSSCRSCCQRLYPECVNSRPQAVADRSGVRDREPPRD